MEINKWFLIFFTVDLLEEKCQVNKNNGMVNFQWHQEQESKLIYSE